jgi:hypothetical protein
MTKNILVCKLLAEEAGEVGESIGEIRVGSGPEHKEQQHRGGIGRVALWIFSSSWYFEKLCCQSNVRRSGRENEKVRQMTLGVIVVGAVKVIISGLEFRAAQRHQSHPLINRQTKPTKPYCLKKQNNLWLTMTGTKAAKKRVRETTPVDVDPDKKLKETTAETIGKVGASTAAVNGSVDIRPSSSPTRSRKATPPPEAFKSPAIGNAEEQETPYMTARQGGKSGKSSPSKKSTPAKLVEKLDAVKEEEDFAKKPATIKEPVKTERPGSLLVTALLFFLWVGSSAVLGGLFLVEKMNHEMRVFELQQELLDSAKSASDQGKPASGNVELTQLVEELKARTAEAESKLAGYKLEFEESLTKLETK